MFNILITDFEKYRDISNNILHLLKGQGYTSIYDIHTIMKIISGFPHCLDQEGHFSYKGKFYNSMNDLPLEALKELQCRLEHGGAI